MYDGKNIKIHFFAKDNPKCLALYCLQLVSLFCCDTWMPNSTRVLRYWADNGLVVIQQIIRRHSRTFEQLQEIQPAIAVCHSTLNIRDNSSDWSWIQWQERVHCEEWKITSHLVSMLWSTDEFNEVTYSERAWRLLLMLALILHVKPNLVNVHRMITLYPLSSANTVDAIWKLYLFTVDFLLTTEGYEYPRN